MCPQLFQLQPCIACVVTLVAIVTIGKCWHMQRRTVIYSGTIAMKFLPPSSALRTCSSAAFPKGARVATLVTQHRIITLHGDLAQQLCSYTTDWTQPTHGQFFNILVYTKVMFVLSLMQNPACAVSVAVRPQYSDHTYLQQRLSTDTRIQHSAEARSTRGAV